VPLGVIGIVYEARPNVTFDVFSLCLKSGNAVLLKGGSDAHHSNTAIVRLISESLSERGFDPNTATLLPADRHATLEMLHADRYVDLVIPRGSQALIDFVRQNARVPVIETGAGIVHTYIDASAHVEMASDIVHNAKTRRVSVCNALDCLVVHRDRLPDLPAIVEKLAAQKVRLYADPASFHVLKGKYPDELLDPAEDQHFGTEFLSYKMAIKTVAGFQEALEHIALYSSKHSEAIVAEDKAVSEEFLRKVDAAAVYVNCSTTFTDGAQFGMGAEIGISTQKLHARGPMALPELTSYKWLVRGQGQVRWP
jgi:glutamate-5-semialdehyde dehydrogenase